MTIEELANLKPGDRLMWRGNVVTMKGFNIIVDRGGATIYMGDDDIEQIELLSGPTLPPHVAEIWEWDGEPKKNGDIEGWVWDDGWPHPLYTFSY